jgi:hypothetical protein
MAGVNLLGRALNRCNLRGADLSGADLRHAELGEADLSGANLQSADLREATLVAARMMHADLSDSQMWHTDLANADLRGATLRRATIRECRLTDVLLNRADLSGATIVRCSIFGISAWETIVDGTQQSELRITRGGEPHITVDNMIVAQFIHLLLNNQQIRDAIDTITSKVVLILGNFGPQHKQVLDAIRSELRSGSYNLVPVVFDFDRPASRDVTGTVETLARMARFIIADLTDPSSVPHELAIVAPFIAQTPIQPLRRRGTAGYGMFADLQRRYPGWVLATHEYDDGATLINDLPKVIAPANQLADLLRTAQP